MSAQTSGSQNTLLRLLRLVLPFWRGMLASSVLSLITIGTSIGLMATSAWLISKAGLQPSVAELGTAPVMVRFFGIGRGVFRYLERLVSHHITFRLLADLRVWFYRAIEPLAPARLMEFHSGDLLGRVVADVDELQNLYLRVIAPPLVALLTAAVMVVFFLGFDPLLVVILLGFMLVGGTLLPLLAWRLGQGPGQALVNTRAELHTTLVDTLQGMPDAVAYGYDMRQLAAFEHTNGQLAQQEGKLAGLEAMQTGLMVLVVHLAGLAILVAAVPRVDPIYLATLTLATVAAFEAIMPLVPAAHHLGRSLEAGRRLFALVDAEPAVNDPVHPAAPPRQAHLTVEGLTFGYNGDDALAIQNLNFDLTPGKVLAIVGPSGAGKTTLTNLLLRFWNYETGRILLDGRDLHAYAQSDVRRSFGVMSQRTHLFNTTMAENIRLARDDADDETVMAAAKRAQIHDFILSLPQGYDTLAGEMGANLSGGERQRLALARVLLSDAPIIILDEATANLDAITERAVMRAVFDALADRTLLIITHRLTLLDRADEIMVLDKGHIVERGSHTDLITSSGLYRHLWDLQNDVLL